MPKFTGRDVHIDVPLSNVAIAYAPTGMVGDTIFPVVDVKKQSDAFYTWEAADAFRINDDTRAPGDMAKKLDRAYGSATFYCRNYALREPILYEDMENADAPQLFTDRSAKAKLIKQALMLNMDYRIALKCTSGSNVGSYSSIASGWTGTANATPVANIKTAINNVQDLTGYRPNRVVFGGYAWRLARECDEVKNAVFGSTGTGQKGRIVAVEHMKNLLEVDSVMVASAYRNTTQEGQTMSLSRIWNDNVLVFYAPDRPSIEEPSFAYSFRWNMKNLSMQAQVFDYPDRGAEMVQVGYYQDEKITAKNLGFLLVGVGSSQ